MTWQRRAIPILSLDDALEGVIPIPPPQGVDLLSYTPMSNRLLAGVMAGDHRKRPAQQLIPVHQHC